jgi:phosphoribosylformimino-5-aminoimidazole carboxamide ribotide isomerase
MRIIPVLDLMKGRVVRGIAGRRDEYRPVESRLARSALPFEVARAFRDELGLDEFYVADLDALRGAEPDYDLYGKLGRSGFRLLVDAGVQGPGRASRLADSGVAGVVAALETLPGPGTLAEIVSQLSAQKVIFSLDLHEDKPLGELAQWKARDADSIARESLGCGVRRMIVLDLARVGVGKGVGTNAICQGLREADPDLELITGGGVRGLDDLIHLAQTGVDSVLVASALHDGRIGRAEIEQFA